MALQSIRKDAKDVTERLGLTEHLVLLDKAWQAEAGALETVARPIALQHWSLVVEVDSAPAMQEITLRRKELLRRLNRHFPSPRLKNITLRVQSHG